MDSTLALGALRIARGAGGEGGGREREPRRGGEGRLSLEAKLLFPDRVGWGQKKKRWDWRRFFLRRPFGLPTSQGRGGLGSMDSTLALGALRIARGAGGEGVDVNGSIVEREKGDEFGIETPASSSTIACGQQKVKGGHGSITASSTASSSASSSASIITLNLGVGCAPSCWPIFGFRNLLGARRGRRGQFSVQSE